MTPLRSLFRRNPDFRKAFIAQGVSFAGDWFATVALIGMILDETGSDVGATLVWVAASLPSFLLTAVAGPVADRFDRKKIMVACSVAQAGVALLFLVAQSTWVWLGLIVQAAIAALAAFFSPASQAAVANLVDPEDLPTAVAASSGLWGAMLAVGSALGAVVADQLGRSTAFVVDAASFAIAAALIASIRRPTSQAMPAGRRRVRPLADMAEAIRYARGDRMVSALLLSKAGFGFGAGVVGLLAVLAKREFSGGDGAVGLLLAARGAGALMGPFFVARAARRGLAPVLTLCGVGAIVYGFAYGMVALAPALAVAAAFVFVAHLGGGSQWAGSGYGLQAATPDALKGRILSADFAMVTLTMSLSSVLGGVASGVWGPAPVMLVLGGVEVVWGLVYLRLTRAQRRAQPADPPAVGVSL